VAREHGASRRIWFFLDVPQKVSTSSHELVYQKLNANFCQLKFSKFNKEFLPRVIAFQMLNDVDVGLPQRFLKHELIIEIKGDPGNVLCSS